MQQELSGCEGPRGVRCGSIEGNDGAGCVRAFANENQSVNGAVSVMSVNVVFVGCFESDEYFNTAKLDESKKMQTFLVKNVGQKYLTGRWVCTEKVTDEGRIPKQDL